MDPQAAWDQLLAAYSAGDWDILEERATDLIDWLDRGGFPPTILNQPDLDPDWNRASRVPVASMRWKSPKAYGASGRELRPNGFFSVLVQ